MADFWKHKNVFVTGATGLLGPWLIQELASSGANVTALIRDGVARSNFFNWGLNGHVNCVYGCLTDYLLLERALNEYEIDTVFHLGAQAIVTTANRSPLSTFDSNIKGTWNVLEAVRNSKLVQRAVVASSDKAYGTQKILPYREDAPLQGEHPYDVSKSCADLLAQSYHKTYGLPIGITRCGNFYGGGDLNFNRIVPGTIKSVIHNESPIIRSDGTYIRDYIYIKDAVKAYKLLAEHVDKPHVKGNAFNFSYNNKLTVLEIVNAIIRLMDSGLKPKILNEATGEIKHQYLSSAKARAVLGWEPSYSVEEGLKETIEWYREFFASHK
ncbi:MAG TPA: NAD-dependent epimerase/dehydratase family protein [Nanoarchaeota archaeon]|nr:NAD-dependent epimerase/dehydratase family protein [Nanoarchaeota archaeon]